MGFCRMKLRSCLLIAFDMPVMLQKADLVEMKRRSIKLATHEDVFELGRSFCIRI